GALTLIGPDGTTTITAGDTIGQSSSGANLNPTPRTIPVTNGEPTTSTRTDRVITYTEAFGTHLMTFNTLSDDTGEIRMNGTLANALGFADDVNEDISNVQFQFHYQQGFDFDTVIRFTGDLTAEDTNDGSTTPFRIIFSTPQWRQRDTAGRTSLSTLVSEGITGPSDRRGLSIHYGVAHSVPVSAFVDSMLTVNASGDVFYKGTEVNATVTTYDVTVEAQNLSVAEDATSATFTLPSGHLWQIGNIGYAKSGDNLVMFNFTVSARTDTSITVTINNLFATDGNAKGTWQITTGQRDTDTDTNTGVSLETFFYNRDTTAAATLANFINDWNTGVATNITPTADSLDNGDVIRVTDTSTPGGILVGNFRYIGPSSTFTDGGEASVALIALNFIEFGGADDTGNIPNITNIHGNYDLPYTSGASFIVFFTVAHTTVNLDVEIAGTVVHPAADYAQGVHTVPVTISALEFATLQTNNSLNTEPTIGNATIGRIFVPQTSGGSTITDLNQLPQDGATNGQVITWVETTPGDASTGEWTPADDSDTDRFQIVNGAPLGYYPQPVTSTTDANDHYTFRVVVELNRLPDTGQSPNIQGTWAGEALEFEGSNSMFGGSIPAEVGSNEFNCRLTAAARNTIVGNTDQDELPVLMINGITYPIAHNTIAPEVTLPTVNDGTVTLSAGGGLRVSDTVTVYSDSGSTVTTGDGSFTLNQANDDHFQVSADPLDPVYESIPGIIDNRIAIEEIRNNGHLNHIHSSTPFTRVVYPNPSATDERRWEAAAAGTLFADLSWVNSANAPDSQKVSRACFWLSSLLDDVNTTGVNWYRHLNLEVSGTFIGQPTQAFSIPANTTSIQLNSPSSGLYERLELLTTWEQSRQRAIQGASRSWVADDNRGIHQQFGAASAYNGWQVGLSNDDLGRIAIRSNEISPWDSRNRVAYVEAVLVF
ncbi:MAG: hypothetical protein MPJ25_09245, partial [Pirellulales bacterium]|nr:hypothetical protein [Pirellulales bacterium]